MMPGPLKDAAGFHYQEFSNLKQPMPLKDDPFHVGADNKVSDWAEMIVADTAKPLAFYDHPFFGKYPAITQNQFGSGSFTYEGTVLSDQLQKAVVLNVLERAGLINSDQKLPAGVRVKHAQNRQGKTLHFFINYSGTAKFFPYAYPSGVNILATNANVNQGESILLQPWDLSIVEEK